MNHKNGVSYLIDVCELNRQFCPSSSASSLLLVADFCNNRVAMWSADGRQAISQIDVGGFVYAFCVDLNGFVYVSVGDDVVKIYDPRRNGTAALLQTLGGGIGDAPGHFYEPAGMCVDDTNTLMVVEYYNHRVQFFD